MITSSIHTTRMHAQEIKNNISLIRVAVNDIERNDFNEQSKRFYKVIGHIRKTKLSLKH